jgi:hypothetical protein
VDITFPCYNRKKQFKLVVKKWDAVFFDYGDVLHYVPQNWRLLTSMSDKFLGAVHCKWLKSGETVLMLYNVNFNSQLLCTPCFPTRAAYFLVSLQWCLLLLLKQTAS